MNKPFQRIGSKMHHHTGKMFEIAARSFFDSIGLDLDHNVKIPVGIESITKAHAFDLGCIKQKVIVESKSHRWTKGGNILSAKLTIWNEAMYYFVATQGDYRKIMFVLRDYSSKRGETLAEYYIRTYRHFIPNDVEIWEFDEDSKSAVRLVVSDSIS